MRPPRHHHPDDQQQQRKEGCQSQMETSPPPSLGMSPASRYRHNLKVLRRRDPSIISIFDQFSHVCVYHHDGKKWEKHGYEGSMFLFERDVYPPYGFYILNRMGMEDYIQHIYPEDDISAHGSYLIIRSYPDYMATRMAGIQAKLELLPVPPDKFADVYKIEGIEELDSKIKGRSSIVGLWMFATESMIEVMRRLHSFIQKNIPYPEEFRYGPVRPPPPHRLRAVTKSSSSQYGTSSDASASDSQASYSDSEHSSAGGAVSEVDKLFAKFVPTAPPHPTASSSTMTFPTSTSNMTLESLFAALGGPEIVGPAPPPLAPASTSSTGINLLDSIFASAANLSALSPHQPPPQQGVSASRKIFSPTPSTTQSQTQPQAQVLNQDVISTLLGLPPSRTPSAASSSHPSSREGDDEEEEGSPVSGRGNGLLSVLGNGGVRNGKVNGDVTPRAFLNGRCHTHRADPPLGIEATSSVATIRGLESSSGPSVLRASTHQGANANASAHHQAGASVKPRANRELVPFEADSELWPYPSIQHKEEEEQHDPREEEEEEEEEEDIVELDFEETSVLSDLDAFRRALREQKRGLGSRKDGQSSHSGVVEGSSSREKGKGRKKKTTRRERDKREREEIERSWDVPGFCAPREPVQGVQQGHQQQQPQQQPQQVKPTTTTKYLTQAVTSPPASPSPPLSPSLEDTTPQMPVYVPPQISVHTPPSPRSVYTPQVPADMLPKSIHTPQMRVHTPPRSVHTPAHTPSPRRIPSSDMMTPTMSGKTNGGGTGKGSKVASSLNGSGSAAKVNGNGHGHVGVEEKDGNGNGHDLVRGSIVAALNAQPRLGVAVGMERNEFVREVLTLIHTDRAFVDTLWQEYLARLQ
ncbi:uncharacterized protein LACBIDRAFT_310039 [Laccaria bicolor S238N-H82]|uniref:Predicted protein n=1 Tax=Laccaria bicolor (strain S238N-H82 / ATCC MYA-4686) TaxID=486041 RepID=B0DTI5_LACBS|nr:uncharacterized protein LACBIDRAFT_310039 [Laccaria bicolor S238N-H82]EDR02118.1 predicted protein [Laccaria bicolor S238N-H82]|eukprot:XP_001887275.1 predicted protein [Laccaria bicolor S238N-H82]